MSKYKKVYAVIDKKVAKRQLEREEKEASNE